MTPEAILERSLSEMQGKLFELSGKRGYDSANFIRLFMTSSIVAGLDSKFDFMQWAGKEYILEKMEDDYAGRLTKSGRVYDGEVLYWIGYVYRRWHYKTGESGSEILKQADPEIMNIMYLGYHTLDVGMAIERLKAAPSQPEQFSQWDG